MKEGRTLTELASEIERQNAVKKDYLADTRKMEMVLTDNSPQLAVPDKGLTLALNSVAHRQIGEHTGIPAKYYDKMHSNLPDFWTEVPLFAHWMELPGLSSVRSTAVWIILKL